MDFFARRKSVGIVEEISIDAADSKDRRRPSGNDRAAGLYTAAQHSGRRLPTQSAPF